MNGVLEGEGAQPATPPHWNRSRRLWRLVASHLDLRPEEILVVVDVHFDLVHLVVGPGEAWLAEEDSLIGLIVVEGNLAGKDVMDFLR